MKDSCFCYYCDDTEANAHADPGKRHSKEKKKKKKKKKNTPLIFVIMGVSLAVSLFTYKVAHILFDNTNAGG